MYSPSICQTSLDIVHTLREKHNIPNRPVFERLYEIQKNQFQSNIKQMIDTELEDG